MDAAVIVIRKMQRDRCLQVLPLFRERIGEPRQSANLHPRGEVLAFNVRCANALKIRHPGSWEVRLREVVILLILSAN